MPFSKACKSLFAVLAAAGFAGVVWTQSGFAAASGSGLIDNVRRLVESEYVERVPEQQLVDGALKGMLQSLDPHSEYMTEKEFRAFQTNTRGSFGGIGIEIGQRDQRLVVIAPIDGTPAAQAGLKAGDRIVTIDGEPAAELNTAEAVGKLRGPVGAPVTIGIEREGSEPFQVRLIRAVVEVDPVKGRLDRGIGIIRLSIFNEKAAEGVERAVRNIRAEAGGEPKGWILDLRNDPGGLLDQSIEVSDLFLDRGGIVSVKGRQGRGERHYGATLGDVTGGAPMVVLINGGSASAAEIVAGALQDHKRATIVGTQSFGKGSVQTVVPLQGQGAVRLTTARYYTPNGRSIQAVGITPDVRVEGNGALEPKEHEADLKGALINETLREAPGAQGPKEKRGMPGSSEGGDTGPDLQLERAMELLLASPQNRQAGVPGDTVIR